MGLFSRKKQAEGEPDPDPVQAELASITARLAVAEQARIDLERRLATIDETNAALAAQVEATGDDDTADVDARIHALDHGFGMLGEQLGNIERSTSAIQERLGTIDARMDSADVRVDAIHHRLGESEAQSAAIDDLDTRLRELADRTGTPLPTALLGAPSSGPVDLSPPVDDAAAPQPPPIGDLDGPVASGTDAPPPPPPTSSAHELDVQERLADMRTQLSDVTDRMSSLDDRVTGIATELAHQLTELSRDIDELNHRAEAAPDGDAGAAADGTVDADVEARLLEQIDGRIDEVLGSTEKLAAEQARYEIQFRADLAELAERFRRPGTG